VSADCRRWLALGVLLTLAAGLWGWIGYGYLRLYWR
jgi:hypothetical protein